MAAFLNSTVSIIMPPDPHQDILGYPKDHVWLLWHPFHLQCRWLSLRVHQEATSREIFNCTCALLQTEHVQGCRSTFRHSTMLLVNCSPPVNSFAANEITLFLPLFVLYFICILTCQITFILSELISSTFFFSILYIQIISNKKGIYTDNCKVCPCQNASQSKSFFSL